MTHWVEELASDIRLKWDRHLDGLRFRQQSAAPSNRASSLGHPCLRYLVLCRTDGERKRPPSRRLQSLFLAGQQNEPETKRIMSEMGFNFWAGDQLSWPANDWKITGHIDSLYARGDEAVIVELKRTNQHTFEKCNSWEDFTDPLDYFSRWRDQLITYIFLAQSSEYKIDHGLFLLRSGGDGWIKPIPVPMDWERAEEIVYRCETVNRFVESSKIPDYHEDVSVCKRCPFYGDVCNPPMDWGEGVKVVGDPWAVERFDRMRELSEQGKEFKSLDTWARAYVREMAGNCTTQKHLMVGSTLVEVTPGATVNGVQRRIKFIWGSNDT